MTATGGTERSLALPLRVMAFFVAVALVATVWLALLPWLGRQGPIRRHVEQQQQTGVDPSAMFYSELEILPPLAHRVERQMGRSP